VRKLICLVVGGALLALLYFAPLWLHAAFLEQARPAQAPSPGQTPFSLAVPVDVQVTGSSLEPLEDGRWRYTWRLTGPSTAETLFAGYQQAYPQAPVTGEGADRRLEVDPEGNGRDLYVLTLPASSSNSGEVQVQSVRESEGLVPSLLTVRIAMLVLMVPVLALLWHPLVHLWNSQPQRLQEPPDAATIEAWREPLVTLEQSGFQNTFDYRVSSAYFPNCARLLYRERQTLAILQFALLDRQPYTYLEMQTRFDDGSVVVTSTNLYAGILARPEWYVLTKLPQDSEAGEVVRLHEEAVAQHLTRELEVVPFEPDAFFDMWKEVRKECLTGAKGEAAGLVETHDVVSRTSRTPSEAVRPVKALSQKAFLREVTRRFKALDPGMEVAVKDGLNLHLRSGNRIWDLDTETVFFMCQNNPADVDQILAGFLARFAPQGSKGRA